MDADAIVEDLAAQQYGTAAVRQLRAAGISRHLQRRRVEARRWILQTPRVLRLPGAPESAEQRVMIAALDAGVDAIASHETAAWLWRFPGFAAGEFVIRRREPTSGARPAHRPTLVLPHHRTVVRDIPCTTLPRTLVDLSSVLPGARMERLVDTVITRSPAMLPALHRTFAEEDVWHRPWLVVEAVRAARSDELGTETVRQRRTSVPRTAGW